MSVLVKRFESSGLGQVRAYRASGNIEFEFPGRATDRLKASIERSLHEEFGAPVIVFLRSMDALGRRVASRPFGPSGPGAGTRYVSFLPGPVADQPNLPLESARGDVELLRIDGADVFSRAMMVNGRRGFPNSFVEQLFRVPATTRNWSTVEGLVAQAASDGRRTSAPRDNSPTG